MSNMPEDGMPPQEPPKVFQMAPGVIAGSPDEVQKFIDQQSMLAVGLNDLLSRNMEDAPPEVLAAFRFMLHMARTGGTELCAYFEGMLTSILRFKHGVCVGCGNKHDDYPAWTMHDGPGETTGGDYV